MKELFDQTTKMMEQSWKAWESMLDNSPWLAKPPTSFAGQWKPWFATMGSTFEVNMSAWQTVVDHSEETFFKMLKDSPVYTETLEAQLRELWDGMKKANTLQQDTVKTNLERMESLLKD